MCEHIHTLLYECKGTHIFDNFFIFQFFWFLFFCQKKKYFSIIALSWSIDKLTTWDCKHGRTLPTVEFCSVTRNVNIEVWNCLKER